MHKVSARNDLPAGILGYRDTGIPGYRDFGDVSQLQLLCGVHQINQSTGKLPGNLLRSKISYRFCSTTTHFVMLAGCDMPFKWSYN